MENIDAQYWMLGAGELGRPRGVVWGGRREEGSGWGTHVYLWQIHFDIWQNWYNIVKFKNKTKLKKKNSKKKKGIYMKGDLGSKLVTNRQGSEWVKVAQLCLTYLRPHGLYRPWNSPGQNTGVGSLFLLQGIFPIQGLNPGLPHCRQILYQLSHKGSPTDKENDIQRVDLVELRLGSHLFRLPVLCSF